MEHISAPASGASPSTAAPASATKQPTYTTAGTIYNPSSSQPLLPPTRRGRSFKWANGSPTTGLTFFPKELLATLPLRNTNNRTPVLQQYSPLQQNYDRAIGPGLFDDQDPFQSDMVPQETMDNIGNAPATLSSLCACSSEDRSVYEDDIFDSDDNSDFSTDPLVGMPVKSLQNLASYPNPNQKRARKALRGAKPNLAGFGRALSSPRIEKQNFIRPIGSPPKSDITSDTVYSGPPGLASTRRGQVSSQDRSEPSRRGTPVMGPPMTPSLELLPGPSTLSDGPGAPRPLTAGPPGQRQYRPSTFESTFKALKSKIEQGLCHELGVDINKQKGTAASHGVSGWGLSAVAPSFVSTGSASPTSVSIDGSKKFMFARAECDTLDVAAIGPKIQRDSNGEPYTRNSLAVPEPWTPSIRNPAHAYRFAKGSDRLNESELRVRNEKIDQVWNSWKVVMEKAPSAAGLDTKSHGLKQAQRFGVIGDRRPGRAGKQNQRMSIDEANKISRADHAKPLLEMTFVTLQRMVEETKLMEEDSTKKTENIKQQAVFV